MAACFGNCFSGRFNCLILLPRCHGKKGNNKAKKRVLEYLERKYLPQTSLKRKKGIEKRNRNNNANEAKISKKKFKNIEKIEKRIESRKLLKHFLFSNRRKTILDPRLNK